MVSSYTPDSRTSPGVISLKANDANAARDAAGRKAVVEIQPGSEFEIEIPEDLQACYDRLDEIREELGELSNKLYGASMMGAAYQSGYAGPPTAVKIQIQYEMRCHEAEEAIVQARIVELAWAAPPLEEDEAGEAYENDRGDATQPGVYTKGPARGVAMKKLYPDQNRS